jgi:hypothetical protein
LTKWGFNPNAPQILFTLSCDNPTFCAMDRVDQWVLPAGFSSRVRQTTSSTSSSAIVRGIKGDNYSMNLSYSTLGFISLYHPAACNQPRRMQSLAFF